MKKDEIIEQLRDMAKHPTVTLPRDYEILMTAADLLAQQSNEQVEPVAWESILGAVARGWCYEENANKTMDSELAVAIAKEVQALYTHPPVPTAQPKKPEQEPVTVLPDGSAFAVMSYPLPKDHWLYAERQYEGDADEPNELGKPILTHALRDAVVSAVRYAIRGATNCGKELDFDPDALVQNAVYALCGPYGLAESKKPEQEPVAFPDAPKTIYLQVGDECPEDAKWKELIDVCWCDEQVFDNDIVYVRADTTQPQRNPLMDEELRTIENKINPNMRWRSSDEEGITLYPIEYYELVRAIEAAHGIKE